MRTNGVSGIIHIVYWNKKKWIFARVELKSNQWSFWGFWFRSQKRFHFCVYRILIPASGMFWVSMFYSGRLLIGMKMDAQMRPYTNGRKWKTTEKSNRNRWQTEWKNLRLPSEKTQRIREIKSKKWWHDTKQNTHTYDVYSRK